MANTSQSALSILKSRRRSQRPSAEALITEASFPRERNSDGRTSLRGVPSLMGMKQWLERIGCSVPSRVYITRVTILKLTLGR